MSKFLEINKNEIVNLDEIRMVKLTYSMQTIYNRLGEIEESRLRPYIEIDFKDGNKELCLVSEATDIEEYSKETKETYEKIRKYLLKGEE